MGSPSRQTAPLDGCLPAGPEYGGACAASTPSTHNAYSMRHWQTLGSQGVAVVQRGLAGVLPPKDDVLLIRRLSLP